MKDLKEALGSNRKPDVTHVRQAIKNYVARACEYGSAKYERANFLRPLPTPKENFERLREYLRATISHVGLTLEAMEQHQALDPNLEDLEGMKQACYAKDTDVKKGCTVGPSLLPHLAHASASLMMTLSQAVNADLLPLDPGTPWANPKPATKNQSSNLVAVRINGEPETFPLGSAITHEEIIEIAGYANYPQGVVVTWTDLPQCGTPKPPGGLIVHRDLLIKVVPNP